jgi:hypothetical protein
MSDALEESDRDDLDHSLWLSASVVAHGASPAGRA